MMKKKLTAAAAAGLSSALALVLAASPGVGQSTQAKPTTPQASAASLEDWWKNAVIYEVYPRSFQDSNGDGIGDLNGITQRLDYLEKLGVDAIWITPCYPSPQADFGYDIADYEGIDPQYGTMADFDRLVAEAAKHHIRIVMDMVANHSSDEHKWFKASRSSKTNPYRDWYVWKDGKGETATDKGAPPNNWLSEFGHSAWEWDEKTRQYYYHKFYVKQPDFNWNNPKVEKAFDDIVKFWTKKGVAGFRFDAITTLFEDPSFADETVVKDKNGNPVLNVYGDVQTDGKLTDNLPGVDGVMAHMRTVFDAVPANKFPGRRVMIGETYVPSITDLARLYGTKDKPEFELPMDMQLGITNKMDAVAIRTKLTDVETKIGSNLPLLVFENHDNPRIDARYGDGVHNPDITRVLSTVLLASHGASMFYYGSELGMTTTPPTRKEDVKDPVGVTGWPKEKGRDGERTPMQWDDTANAGFSTETAKPWLPVPANKAAINVKAEEADPNSLLNWYKALISLKKTHPALAGGEMVMLDVSNTKTLSWLRSSTDGKRKVVVVTNFTAEPQTVNLASEVTGSGVKTLLKSPSAKDATSLGAIEVPGFGVFVGEVE